MVFLSRSCYDLAMIVTSIPCIMICHDLDKGTMVNHDLARFTMIMASVPWLRTLSIFKDLHSFKKAASLFHRNCEIPIDWSRDRFLLYERKIFNTVFYGYTMAFIQIFGRNDTKSNQVIIRDS